METITAPSALLVVTGEPVAPGSVSAVLNRIVEGLSAWRCDGGFVHDEKPDLDLNAEIRNFLNAHVAPEKLDTGGSVLRFSSHNLYIEILVNPTVQTLQSSLAHFLILPASRKHLIHAGTAFAGSGSWILHDGTWSFHDFSRLLHRADVTTALSEINKHSALVVSCFPEGEWNEQGVKHHGFDKLGKIAVGILKGHANIDAANASDLQKYLEKLVSYTTSEDLMKGSNVVGSIRFRRPTMHIFPAGQGEAALFGVSGFTILFDGGFARKTCYWDFLRHVDRLDALLISRLNHSNVMGISSFVERIASGCRPELSYVFANIPSKRTVDDKDENGFHPLLLSMHNEGTKILHYLDRLNLKPHQCVMSISPTTKHPEPLTVYQKVGQGRLDMYVLNPTKDSKEYTEFIDSWKKGIHKNAGAKFSTKPGFAGAEYAPTLLDQTSVAVLLVWHPADPEEQIIRVLYPGSCPQEKILAGLEKLKHLDFLKHPTCTSASLANAGKTANAAVAKKPVAAKPVESVKSTPPLASPKGPAAAAPVKAAAAIPAAISATAPVVPKVADAIHEHHHHHPEPTAPILPPTEPLIAAAIPPVVESLLDTAPTPLVHVEPPSVHVQQPGPDLLMEDFIQPQAQSPPLEPEHMMAAHEQAASPAALEDNFFQEEPLDKVESRMAGFNIEAEPMKASPFETVEIGHHVEPRVLRLSTDQLCDNHGDHSLIDVVQEPSPASTEQKSGVNLMDTSPKGDVGFGFGAPAEPVMQLDETDPRSVEKHGHISPGIPTEIAQQILQQQHSPRTQHRLLSALNPDAPEFVPSFGGPPLHQTSPMDPFSDKGLGDGHGSSYTNGGANLLDESAWSTEAAAASPKQAGDTASSPIGDVPRQEQPSPNTQRKTAEELMKEWGQPLGLPVPPVTNKTSNATAASTKPKANGPASAAAKDQPKPGSASASTTTAPKRPAAASATAKASAPSASTKTASTTEKSTTTSTVAKKPAPASASPKTTTATAAPKPSAPTKTATAKSAAAPTAKSPASPRPAAPAAPKTTAAAPPKAAPAAKKPGPPLASYYVDLTYIPHQGNPYYCNAEFFKHIRSKHYVLSSLHPSKEILEALLVGKKAWNLPEEEVTLIPTYDSDTLSLWMSLHKDELASESIAVAPSCIRCTVNLEEHEGAKCSAYRLEL